jgi:GAF domain-containing protein
VEQDPRFNRDFAKSTGYVPGSILAMPLVVGERVVGVMEVLDKIGSQSFGMQDMELLALFAGQAALAIDQAQKVEQLGEALVLSLKRLAAPAGEPPFDRVLAALESAEGLGSQDDLLELARMMYEFMQLGEDERKTALKVLSVFGEYGQSRRRVGRGAGWR